MALAIPLAILVLLLVPTASLLPLVLPAQQDYWYSVDPRALPAAQEASSLTLVQHVPCVTLTALPAHLHRLTVFPAVFNLEPRATFTLMRSATSTVLHKHSNTAWLILALIVMLPAMDALIPLFLALPVHQLTLESSARMPAPKLAEQVIMEIQGPTLAQLARLVALRARWMGVTSYPALLATLLQECNIT